MIEAIKTLKENICAQCAYGSDMENCDIRYCDNREAIKILEHEPCWTPIGEKLPKEKEDVLIQYRINGVNKMAVSCRIDYNYWVGFGRDICVVAWQPLPTPYKEVSE